ncbi:hypothetical protein FO440_14515 [Mucilaginibacter corticis]|uniref:DUF4141 domain-containing protein n=1 Tax=Mucilaginibacter corticis TaxID=2597670 RepID=A0A556MLZ9_9SPHI|nr:hypothetical protein [Mucilaginibacter corticis]TSJ40946.1 hypothetical protein FO440_14515 [Mucilaginibacter corticis]
MKIRFMLFALCFSLSTKAQQYVIDYKYLESVEANQAARMSAELTHDDYLKKINRSLDDINVNTGSVVAAQTIIYNAMANVNSALKDGLAVKNMVVLTADITNYLQQCLNLARSQPYLLLFATGIEHEIQLRSVGLVSEVSGFALKEGSHIMADYNARDQLLQNVIRQLQILDALAYGAWRAMYWAGARGLLASVNPWQNFINHDKAYVQQIVNNAKYLQHP